MTTESTPPEAATETADTPEKVNYVEYDDFAKLDLRIAEITEALPHPNADRLLLLKLKVGDATRQICAGIKENYDPEELVGKRIVIVANLKPRKLRGEISEGMLLAASLDGAANDANGLTLITTDDALFASGASVG